MLFPEWVGDAVEQLAQLDGASGIEQGENAPPMGDAGRQGRYSALGVIQRPGRFPAPRQGPLRRQLKLLPQEPPGVPDPAVVVPRFICARVRQHGDEKARSAQQDGFGLPAQGLDGSTQREHLHGVFVGAVAQGGTPGFIPGLAFPHCCYAAAQQVALELLPVGCGCLQQVDDFFGRHIGQGASAARQAIIFLVAGVACLPGFRGNVEDGDILVQAVAGVPAGRRWAEHDVQHHAVECRIGAVPVFLPILRSGVDFDISADAHPVQFYFRVGEIRAGAAVPPPWVQHADLPMAQGMAIPLELAACPPALDGELGGWRGRSGGGGTGRVDFCQKFPVLGGQVLAVQGHQSRSPSSASWRMRSSSRVSHT